MSETLGFHRVCASRKDHCCSWCGESIEKGSGYYRWFWVNGSDTCHVKMHPECYDVHRDDDYEEFGLHEQVRPQREAGDAR